MPSSKATDLVDKPQTIDDHGHLLTKAETAQALRISERTLRRWMLGRVIPYIKVSGVVRFNLAAVQQALEKRFTVREVS